MLLAAQRKTVAKSQAKIANSGKYLPTDSNELKHTNRELAWRTQSLGNARFTGFRLCWISLKSGRVVHPSQEKNSLEIKVNWLNINKRVYNRNVYLHNFRIFVLHSEWVGPWRCHKSLCLAYK